MCYRHPPPSREHTGAMHQESEPWQGSAPSQDTRRNTHTHTDPHTHAHRLGHQAPCSWSPAHLLEGKRHSTKGSATPTFISTPPRCVQCGVPKHSHGTRGLTASPGGQVCTGPSGALPAEPGGNERPCAFPIVVSRALRGTSPLSLLLQNHSPSRLLGPLPGTEVERAGLESPGGQPCGSEHHQEPRSARQEGPSDICQHITSGPPDVSANVHPARSALLLRHSFFRAFTLTLRDPSQDSELLFLN